jgi:isoleucyl-tRNA synthetase
MTKVKKLTFQKVDPKTDFPAMEKRILTRWYTTGIVDKYLHKNDKSPKRFSFLDGPITANNPMGVHHAWGRTYKDLWQRFFTSLGYKQRYQCGFDCQGLWVEVEVEKDLKFKSKKDIETYGVANFIDKCKERVRKYSAIQTEQSKRLGYFMDWAHSYFTMSDENNYMIWHFLKLCADRGWIYKGHDVVPWCPRCETAISQHEILTEDYRELTHKSVYLKLKIVGRDNEFLLVWTTTPWTLPANTAVAVDESFDYSLVELPDKTKVWVADARLPTLFEDTIKILKTVKGKELLGLKYQGPYDHLPYIKSLSSKDQEKFHIVIATDQQVMPVTVEEGTGLVHTSTSTGEEDHQLGKKLGLPVIPAIDDSAHYLDGYGELTGQNAKQSPEIIFNFLEKTGWLFRTEQYSHRYPVCWRCKAELVWKVADEWYISMDKVDPSDKKKRTLRRQMVDVAKYIHWLPDFGLERELDWLKNMHDWLISKKNRYWGLALPIYECQKCRHFEVIGSKEELKEKSISGWEKFEGHNPHKPWIDEVKIKCPKCGQIVSRIGDVGNPWLDAGIVSFSTLVDPVTGKLSYTSDKKYWKQWFPADFITESFPGQFKNWFYSLIAMSTVLEKVNPFKTVLGYGTMTAEDGRAMHKSLGNYIDFNEGAEKIGVDVMRWMFVTQNPADNLLFGYKKADDTRRRFHLTLWNVYNFFITYATLDGWHPGNKSAITPTKLDSWILTRLDQAIIEVTSALKSYNAMTASLVIEQFVSDLSLWYVRRSRDRVGPSALDQKDKNLCHATLYTVLTTLCKILAPFLPYLSEEIYTNLTGSESVHLADWPTAAKVDAKRYQLICEMEAARSVVEKILSERKLNHIKVRQPLAKVTVRTQPGKPSAEILQIMLDEINIKSIVWEHTEQLSTEVKLDSVLTPSLVEEGTARELIRQIQDERKKLGLGLDQKIKVVTPTVLKGEAARKEVMRQTLAVDLKEGESLQITPL